MSIAEGLTATKAGLDVAKLLMDRLNSPSVDVHEVRLRVQEMLIHVVNAQVALGEAQFEIAELRHQLDQRDDSKALEADMEVSSDGGFLVRRSEREAGVFNPHCPVCWGQTKQAIPLTSGAQGYYTCAIHGSSYQTAAYREAERQRIEKAKADMNAVAIIPGPRSWMG